MEETYFLPSLCDENAYGSEGCFSKKNRAAFFTPSLCLGDDPFIKKEGIYFDSFCVSHDSLLSVRWSKPRKIVLSKKSTSIYRRAGCHTQKRKHTSGRSFIGKRITRAC